MLVTRYLHVREVETLTNIPESTLRFWRWRDRGEGPPSFKIGRRVVYRREVVETWLAQQEAATSRADGAA